jgi:hypothetical protein
LDRQSDPATQRPQHKGPSRNCAGSLAVDGRRPSVIPDLAVLVVPLDEVVGVPAPSRGSTAGRSRSSTVAGYPVAGARAARACGIAVTRVGRPAPPWPSSEGLCPTTVGDRDAHSLLTGGAIPLDAAAHVYGKYAGQADNDAHCWT